MILLFRCFIALLLIAAGLACVGYGILKDGNPAIFIGALLLLAGLTGVPDYDTKKEGE